MKTAEEAGCTDTEASTVSDNRGLVFRRPVHGSENGDRRWGPRWAACARRWLGSTWAIWLPG